jgi:hypothetical protein
MLAPMTLPFGKRQPRGGRNGGLPVWECNGLLAKEMGTLATSDGKTINEDVPVTPKQLIGQVAIDEQQSSAAFCEGSFLWGQQSMSSMEADMFDMAADLAPAEAPTTVLGSTATESAIKRTRMVRARCMASACNVKIAHWPPVRSSG